MSPEKTIPIIDEVTLNRITIPDVLSVYRYGQIRPRIMEEDRLIALWIDKGIGYWIGKKGNFDGHAAGAMSAFVAGAVIVWESLHSLDPSLPPVERDTYELYTTEQSQRAKAALEDEAFENMELFVKDSPVHLHDPLARAEENPILMLFLESTAEEWGRFKGDFQLGAMSVYEMIKMQVEKSTSERQN